jgi:hypothetical protein
VNVRQDARARFATGRLRWKEGDRQLDATSLGILQQFGRWSSITGRGRLTPGKEERAFTLIVDDDDVVLSTEEPQP